MSNCNLTLKILKPNGTPAAGLSVSISKCLQNKIANAAFELSSTSDAAGVVKFTVPQGSALILSSAYVHSLNGQLIDVPARFDHDAGIFYADAAVTKSDVVLGSVDNVSDAGKPVSTAQQAAFDAKKAVYKFTYDFSVLGGAQGSMPLTRVNGALPNKFVIQNAVIDLITPLTSDGSATAGLTTGQAAGDLVAATRIDGAPWSTAGLKETLVLLGTIASLIKTTAARNPAVVIAVADVTAGKFNVFVEGFLSDT